jgi:outer membrane protein assembly factor BamB
MLPRTVLLVLISLSASPLRADERDAAIPGESRPTATRIEEASKRLAEKKPAEAVALLQAVLDSSANDLVALKGGRSLRARWLAQATLAHLDGPSLSLYRRKADPQARKWLAEATKSRDVGLLRRVVDEAFCSQSTPEALTQLGDIAFERGAFDEAEGWWRLLAPLEPVKLANGAPDVLVYPDPPESLVARTRAKQLLARLFRGQNGWKADLAAFRKLHPKASGRLAGRTGVYADTLEAVAKTRAAGAAVAGDWNTFAGDASRQRVVPAPPKLLERLSQLCRPGATWRFDLEQRRRQAVNYPAPKRGQEVDAARRMAFYPVVVGHHAVVADARYITAYDLRTGKSTNWYDPVKHGVGGIEPNLDLPGPLDLRYSLTAAEGCLFARLGAQAIKDIRPKQDRFGQPRVGKDVESILVSISQKPGRDGDRRRWMVRAIDPARKEYAVFEGAPLVSDGRVYIAATRFEGDRVVTAIHCYPAHPEDSAPAALWRTDVCETRELLPAGPGPPAGRQRHRHHLLTLAGSRVAYCSHSGAVVAVDARTGSRAWAVKYPRRDTREPADDPSLRDLAPCLFAEGKLYVAPADSDRLMCLDPATGATIWHRDRLDVVHLLGVGQGRLIFSTWRNPRMGKLYAGGLRAVMADDGSDTGGWLLPDDGGGLAPFGRGLLIGDLVLWPTPVPLPTLKEGRMAKPFGVFAVRQQDGQQADNPTLLHRVPSGNLIYANGCLLVADRQTLHAFVPPEMLPDEDDKEKAADSGEALRRARAAAARGQAEKAEKWYTEAVKGIDEKAPGQRGRRLLAEARQELQDVYLAAAEKAFASKDEKKTEAWLKKAVNEDMPPRDFLHAVFRLAGILFSVSRPTLPDRGRETVRALTILTIDDEKGLPQRVGALGRGRELEVLVAQLRGQRVIRVVPQEDANAEPDALIRLFGTWEDLGCPQAARWVCKRLQQDHAKHPFWIIDRNRRVGEVAPEVLRRLADKGGEQPLSLPLRTNCQVKLGVGETFLLVHSAEGPVANRIWSGHGTSLVCRSRRTGKVEWKKSLPFAPNWLAALGTVVVAGGPDGLEAVHAFNGKRLWTFAAPLLGREPGTPGGEVRVVRDPLPAEPFTEFHLAGGRVFAVQGERRLLALDALTGRVLWQRWAPGAAFGMPAPRGRYLVVLPVGEDNLLAQASARRWLLDAATGKVRHEVRCPLERWPRDPVLLDNDRVCVVCDSRRIDLLDAKSAKVVWTYSLSGKTTLSGEPPLAVGGKDGLFVVIPENVGYRLQRLDPSTGKPMWRRPPLPPLERLEPSAWLVGPKALYHADAAVTARSLVDGTVLWSKPLPAEGGWKLGRSGNSLLAWSERGDAIRFRFRWLAGSLQWRMGPLGARASIHVLDEQKGTLVQRINVEDASLRSRAWLEPGKAGVFPFLLLWREPRHALALTVSWDGKGLLAGLGNQVLSLRVTESHPGK